MHTLGDVEKEIIDAALADKAKQLDKLFKKCMDSSQKAAAEKVINNIKIINKIREDLNLE